MNLYTDYAEEFSKTRQSPWQGWKQVLFQIQKQTQTQGQDKNEELRTENEGIDSLIPNPNCKFLNLRVLDLGCGNGRFLKYLLSEGMKLEEYVGVDNSDILLNIARSEFKNVELRMKHGEGGLESSDSRPATKAQFLKSDLNNIDHLRGLNLGQFDLVVAFGLIHHIESFEARRRLFEETKFLLKEGGIFAIAFWQFPFMKRFKDKLEIFRNERVNELAGFRVRQSSDQRPVSGDYSNQDYILPFGKDAKRFCHYCSPEEIQELEKGLDFELLDEYYEDGKEANQNYYKLYKK